MDATADKIRRELDHFVPRLLQQYDVPGAAVAVVHNGAVVRTCGYGIADLDNRVPVTQDTVFQVASISKTVSAWGILRLVERGEVNLDAPAERYLTRWHLPSSPYDHGAVTIRRLLSHTAGISVRGVKEFEPDKPLPRLEDHFSDAGREGAVQIVQPPGAEFRYSGGGYTILQLIIEEVTGRPFSEFMRDEVLLPVGMVRSSFEWLPCLQPATACAYDREGRRLPNFLFAAKAAAGLYTTAVDLATLAAAGLRGPNGEPPGRGVLPAGTIDLMYGPLTATGEAPDKCYGLGYMVKTLPHDVRVIGHTGDNWGWKAAFAAIPEKAAAIVALTNSDNGSLVHGDIYRYWIKELTGVEEPARFFAATILDGCLCPSGILEAGRWDSKRLEWRTEREIDAHPALRAGRGKITTWRALKVMLEASATTTEEWRVWIHEDILYEGLISGRACVSVRARGVNRLRPEEASCTRSESQAERT